MAVYSRSLYTVFFTLLPNLSMSGKDSMIKAGTQREGDDRKVSVDSRWVIDSDDLSYRLNFGR